MYTVENRPWTDEYDNQAAHEGWNLFTVLNDLKNGWKPIKPYLKIQRIDDPTSYDWWTEDMSAEPRFADDAAALRFVKRIAKHGAKHAQVALDLIKNQK